MIQIITRYGNLLLLAMGQTLLLALCGLFFACILGMFFGLLSVLKNKACRIISSIFVDVIRGVPMIVLAYFIYFGVPYCLNNMRDLISHLQHSRPVLSASPLTVVLIWQRSSVQVSCLLIPDRWKQREVLVFHIRVP